MTLLHHALQAGLAPATPTAAAPRRLLVIGAGGALGSAVLERLLADAAWSRVATLVIRPVEVAMRGLQAWPHDAAGGWQRPADLPWAPDTAVLVFDRERGRHGREAALLRPDPAQLAAMGRWLRSAGVRRLLLVTPHAPGLLPQALKAGLASLDEQALAMLGFEQLVLVRPARLGGEAGTERHWGRRIARALLAQLHWMVPQREQPLRPVKVAAFVAELARALPQLPVGTRVVPPELLWQWAQPEGGGAAVLQAWLGPQPG
ncbi:MAG: hypothetical protein KBC73_01915 [Burkholderiaceae bacterium]|nr:hypothetical protein [Burkholderiaceae bacterium]